MQKNNFSASNLFLMGLSIKKILAPGTQTLPDLHEVGLFLFTKEVLL